MASSLSESKETAQIAGLNCQIQAKTRQNLLEIARFGNLTKLKGNFSGLSDSLLGVFFLNLANAQLAQQLVAGGTEENYQSVASLLARSERLYPDNPRLYWAKAKLANALNNVAEKKASIDTLLELRPGDPLGLFELGLLEEKQGNHTRAMALWKMLGPDAARVFLNEGESLVHEGQPNQAEYAYKIAIELDSKLAIAYYDLGALYWGKPGKAIPVLEQGIRVDKPGTYEAIFAQAKIYILRSEWQLAAEQLKQVIRIQPRDPWAYFFMGVSLQKLGRLDEAEQNFLEVLRLNPSHAQANLHLGMLAEGRQNWQVALLYYQRAGELNANFAAESHARRGCIYSSLGSLSNAIQEYRSALELMPARQDYVLSLAKLYYDSGDLASAQHLCEQILQVDPKNQVASDLLALIKSKLNP